MIQHLYDKLGLPDACHLGKRVFKKLFHENAQLGMTDKKAFAEDVDTITWQYTLKPSISGGIAIQPYQDDQREYQEVAILQADLKTQRRTARIAEVIHRAIPYPVVLVLAFEEDCAISLAHKRFSQAEKGAIVAEEFITTDWIPLAPESTLPIQRAFLDSLALAGLPPVALTHYFAFYSALVDRVIALQCARLTGEYRFDAPGDEAAGADSAQRREQRRQQLARCHELEARIVERRAAAAKESQVNRLVEVNLAIKQLESELAQAAARL